MKKILFLDLDGTLTKTGRKSLIESFFINFMPMCFFDFIRLLMKYEIVRFLFSKIIFYLNISRDPYINKEKLSKVARMLNKLRKRYVVIVITNRKTSVEINSNIRVVYCRKYKVPKPSMIIPTKILKTLKAEKCIFVGDSIFTDIFPAMNIGCNCFWISEKTPRYHKKINVFHNFEEVFLKLSK